ncbi:hypothetical protein COOONC_11317 [Cooperia oncophora]
MLKARLRGFGKTVFYTPDQVHVTKNAAHTNNYRRTHLWCEKRRSAYWLQKELPTFQTLTIDLPVVSTSGGWLWMVAF